KYIKANNNNTSPNRLIDITSLVKSATPISSNTNHLSIKGVERTCDRVAIIKNGIIVSELNITDIKHNENKRYKIEFIKAADYDKFNKEDLNISCKEKSKKHVVVNVKDEDVNEFFHVLNKYEIKYFSEIKNSLEDYFMSFYGEDK
ncbi:MAG: DUF4162 domain-containing protein, partial [Bacilli bacterium]